MLYVDRPRLGGKLGWHFICKVYLQILSLLQQKVLLKLEFDFAWNGCPTKSRSSELSQHTWSSPIFAARSHYWNSSTLINSLNLQLCWWSTLCLAVWWEIIHRPCAQGAKFAEIKIFFLCRWEDGNGKAFSFVRQPNHLFGFIGQSYKVDPRRDAGFCFPPFQRKAKNKYNPLRTQRLCGGNNYHRPPFRGGSWLFGGKPNGI